MEVAGLARHARASSVLAALSVLALGPLAAWDAQPAWFDRRAHDALGALPLAAIGLACLAQRSGRPSSLADWTRAVILAAAFFAWAINQMWPESASATLWNDAAIALFVIDVFLTVWQQPAAESQGGPSTPAV